MDNDPIDTPNLTGGLEIKPPNYSIKGFFNDFGSFQGTIYNNNRKFGQVNRVNFNIINLSGSIGKETELKLYKDWLRSNKLTQYQFLSTLIDNFIVENPNKLVDE